MKSTKKIISIMSLVFFAIMLVQSPFLDYFGLYSKAHMFTAFAFLLCGLIGLIEKSQKGDFVIAGSYLVFGGISGVVEFCKSGRMINWSIVCVVFAFIYIIDLLFKFKCRSMAKVSTVCPQVECPHIEVSEPQEF